MLVFIFPRRGLPYHQLTGEKSIFGLAEEKSVDQIIEDEIMGAAINVPYSFNR